MNRRVELELGNVKIEATDKYLDLKNVLPSGDEELLARFELNDDGKTCRPTFTRAFDEVYEKRTRPYELSITDGLNRKINFSKNGVIAKMKASDLPDFLKKYIEFLIENNFIEMEEDGYPTGFCMDFLIDEQDEHSYGLLASGVDEE